MQTSYDGDTLAIQGALSTIGRACHYALRAAALHAPPPRAEAAMRIVTPNFGPGQQLTWTIVLVPGQWLPTVPTRRKGFGPWYDKLKQLAELTDGWDSYTARHRGVRLSIPRNFTFLPWSYSAGHQHDSLPPWGAWESPTGVASERYMSSSTTTAGCTPFIGPDARRNQDARGGCIACLVPRLHRQSAGVFHA